MIKKQVIYASIFIILLSYFLFFHGSKNNTPRDDVGVSATLPAGLVHQNTAVQTVPSEGVSSPSQRGSDLQLSLGEGEFENIVSSSLRENVLERNSSLNRLKALAKEESQLERIFREVNSLESDHPAFSTIVAALAAVGTPSIQKRLRHILELRQTDWRAYAAVVPAFAFLQQPTDETIEFLSQRSRHADPDYASTAALALGSIVRTLHVRGESAGPELLQLYIDKLRDPNTQTDDLSEALAVLGNAGLSETEADIVSLLRHSEPSVRADAALALRFVAGRPSEQALLELLKNDVDLDVRMTVIDALAHRPVSAVGLAAVQSIVSSVAAVPSELREKSLDLFLHAELTPEEKREYMVWLQKRVVVESEPSTKKKMNSVLQLLTGFEPR